MHTTDQYERVKIAGFESALNTPKVYFLQEDGIEVYSCLIPQDHTYANRVYFVSGTNGDEYGSFVSSKRALAVAHDVLKGRAKAEAKPALEVPELDEHSTSWVHVDKHTGKLVSEHFSMAAAGRGDPEKHVVMTRNQYLGHLNSMTISQSGAKDLLEQIERRGLAGFEGYPELLLALKAFVK